MLEDLVTAAVNAAVEKARAAADAHLQKATGGIKVPGVGG
jgi:DNA-binding protein YbaB